MADARDASPSTPRDPRVRAWLVSAEADAEGRGLPELKPTLRQFAQLIAALRSADWNLAAPPDDA